MLRQIKITRIYTLTTHHGDFAPRLCHSIHMSQILIQPVQTDKCHVPQPEAVKRGILPKLPASYLVIGRSGSGKSTVLYNLLSSPALLGGYFNFIFVFSDVKVDDILSKLNLPEENYVQDFDDDTISGILNSLEQKIDEQGLERCADQYKVAFIFDDILNRQRFLRGDAMRKLASTNRHFLVSWFILSQYYKAIPPVIRTNASAIIYFPASLAENERLADEQCLPGMSKRQFIELVDYATSGKHDFMFINNKADKGMKIRKGFDKAISIG